MDATDRARADAAPSPRVASERPAWRSRSAWIVLVLVTALGLAADLGTKAVAFRTVAGSPVTVSRQQVLSLPDARHVTELVPQHSPVTVIPHVLDFRLVLNPGAVFGVGPGKRWFFVGFTGVALIFGLWMFARWTRAGDHVAHAAIGLVIAGGLGNLYDRLVYGCVRDFIHPLPGVHWPFGLKPMGGDGEIWPYISNVADLLLLVGIAMLLVFLWRRDRGSCETAEAQPGDDSNAGRG